MNQSREMPLGKLFSLLAKDYLGTFSQRLKDLPISRYHYPLVLINDSSGPMCQQSLATELFVDKVSVVRIVDYLSEAGLVIRRQNPDDRREQHLQLTAAGKKLVPEIRKAMADTNALSLQGFSQEEISQLENMLSKMSCNLKHQPQDSFHLAFFKSEEQHAK